MCMPLFDCLFMTERTVQNVKYGLITKPDLRTSVNNGNFTVNVVYKKSFRLYSNENHQIHRMESNAFLVRLNGQNPSYPDRVEPRASPSRGQILSEMFFNLVNFSEVFN